MGSQLFAATAGASPSAAASMTAGQLSFIVGQDDDGAWVAIEEHGLGGGLFASRDAALGYAAFETHRRQHAVRLVSERLTFRI